MHFFLQTLVLLLVGSFLVMLHHAVATLDRYPTGTLVLVTAQGPLLNGEQSVGNLRFCLGAPFTGMQLHERIGQDLRELFDSSTYVVMGLIIVKPGSL